jgi:hypothetical protein
MSRYLLSAAVLLLLAKAQTGSNPAVVIFSGRSPVLSPGKPALVVVSSTSTMQGDLKCTGTNDERVIQTALDYFAVTGGTITLSDGVFLIANQLRLVSNIILQGQGMLNTTIRSQDNIGPFTRGAGTIRGTYSLNTLGSILPIFI